MTRLITILLMLTGCASPLNDPDRAIALARTCSTERGVSGSPLDLAHPTLQRRGAREWSVSFSEEAPRAIPSGRDLIVDLAAGTCAHAIMD